MRPLAPIAAIALCSCSLIRTTMPAPVASWTARSECNDSYAPPIIDGAIGAGGVAGLGLGVLTLSRGTDVNGNSLVAPGLGLMGAGLAVAGLFVTSTVLGARRVGECRSELASWDAAHPGQRPEDKVEMIARQSLRCPVDSLQRRNLDFARGDARRDTHPWAEEEIVGCGRVTWCGEVDGRSRCGPPAELEHATEQLAIETGCPVASIQQEQFLNISTQVTYRLSACGHAFTCSVPLIGMNDTSVMTGREQEHDRAGGSAFGSQLTCKPALSAEPAPMP